jgi:hypothetical protein
MEEGYLGVKGKEPCTACVCMLFIIYPSECRLRLEGTRNLTTKKKREKDTYQSLVKVGRLLQVHLVLMLCACMTVCMCAYVLIRGGHERKGWWCRGELRGGIGGLNEGEGGEEGRGGERRGEEREE